MRLIEVPFSIRPRPMFLHPFDVREEVMDTVARGMKLALQSVELQCRIDRLSGREFSLIHVTSHPWEFSHMKVEGIDGKGNIKRLRAYLDELLSRYDTRFLTVAEFTAMYEKESCPMHSKRGG
jgi:hypothetical protein